MGKILANLWKNNLFGGGEKCFNRFAMHVLSGEELELQTVLGIYVIRLKLE